MEAILRRHMLRSAAIFIAGRVLDLTSLVVLATVTNTSATRFSKIHILFLPALLRVIWSGLTLCFNCRNIELLKHVWGLSAYLHCNPFTEGYTRRTRISPPDPSEKHSQSIELIATRVARFNLIRLPPEIRTIVFEKYLEEYHTYFPVNRLQNLESLISRIDFFEGLKSNPKLHDEAMNVVLKSIQYAVNRSTFRIFENASFHAENLRLIRKLYIEIETPIFLRPNRCFSYITAHVISDTLIARCPLCPAISAEIEAYARFLINPHTVSIASNVQCLDLDIGQYTQDQNVIFARAASLIRQFRRLRRVKMIWKGDETRARTLKGGNGDVRVGDDKFGYLKCCMDDFLKTKSQRDNTHVMKGWFGCVWVLS